MTHRWTPERVNRLRRRRNQQKGLDGRKSGSDHSEQGSIDHDDNRQTEAFIDMVVVETMAPERKSARTVVAADTMTKSVSVLPMVEYMEVSDIEEEEYNDTKCNHHINNDDDYTTSFLQRYEIRVSRHTQKVRFATQERTIIRPFQYPCEEDEASMECYGSDTSMGSLPMPAGGGGGCCVLEELNNVAYECSYLFHYVGEDDSDA